MNETQLQEKPGVPEIIKPRIGFLGVGWIGRSRMSTLAQCGIAKIEAIADVSLQATMTAAKIVPEAIMCRDINELLDKDLDGIVIATPNVLHAEHTFMALEAGLAVFCQKPLGRTRQESEQIIQAARKADKLLSVDLSYRHLSGIQKIRQLVSSGELGHIYGINLVFHNAYGPDKEWFYNSALSGGGCVIDLGIHLVDLALWILDYPEMSSVESTLFSKGRFIKTDSDSVEDYAVAQMETEEDCVVNLACSWKLPAGQDAVIEFSIYGTKGGASLKNVEGSFYNFRAEKFLGTAREIISEPPENWGGKAIQQWAKKLSENNSFDEDVEHIINAAAIIDRIYKRN